MSKVTHRQRFLMPYIYALSMAFTGELFLSEYITRNCFPFQSDNLSTNHKQPEAVQHFTLFKHGGAAMLF